MADIEKTIAIIFEGDDRVGNTITGISGGLDSMASSAATATEPLANIAESALKLEAALVALVAGGFALAISKAGEFSDSFNEISTLTDASSENLKVFKDDILDYSRTSTASLDDINASVYTAISAGTDYADSLALLSTSEKLATAGKADLEATTRLLASSMNAYGVSTEEASKFSDAFFQTVKLGQTTLPELAESMAQVTPIASQLDVPIETLTASIAALTSAGVPTSQAITQVRSALVAFAKPSKEASEIAEQLGVDFSASAVASKGLETVLKEVYVAADGDVSVLSKLFGRVEALNAGLVLGGDENKKFAQTLETLRDSAGSTEIAFAKMAENLDQVSQTLKNNLRATLIDFGTPLLDESVDVMSAISNVFQSVSFSFKQGAFDPVFNLIESFGAGLAEDIEAIAKALPEAFENVDWSGLVKSIENLGGSVTGLFNAFFDDVDLTTPEGLSSAIQKIVDSGTSLTNVVAGILKSWEPFVEAISDAIDGFNESDASIQELVGQFLGWGQVINTVADNIGVLTGALNLIGGALSVLAVSSLPTMISTLKTFASTIGTASLGVGQFVAVVGAPVAGWAIGTWLRENIPIVKDFGDALGEAAFNLINFGDDSVETAEKQARQTQALADQRLEMVRVLEASGELPEQKTTNVEITGATTYEEDLAQILTEIQSVPEERQTQVAVEVDKPSVAAAVNYIDVELPDGTITKVGIDVDQPSLENTKTEIAKIPAEKELEIKIKSETEIELAKIEAQAAIVQTSLEWEAKVDIAEVEAMAEIITGLSGDISAMFQSTGDVITGLAGELSGLSASEFLDVSRWIEEENARRDELLRLETELTAAQVAYMNARTAALQGGQGLVTIRGENLEPELQLVLNRIIELTQITANEQGLEFLIGV